jgi:hypothetical protein
MLCLKHKATKVWRGRHCPVCALTVRPCITVYGMMVLVGAHPFALAPITKRGVVPVFTVLALSHHGSFHSTTFENRNSHKLYLRRFRTHLTVSVLTTARILKDKKPRFMLAFKRVCHHFYSFVVIFLFLILQSDCSNPSFGGIGID